MILVKKINQQNIIVNCELIETIEFSHHAVISMTSGVKIIIDEGPEDIIGKVIEYKRSINSRSLDICSSHSKSEGI